MLANIFIIIFIIVIYVLSLFDEIKLCVCLMRFERE